MTPKKQTFRVMAATVPLVNRDDQGREIGRTYVNQGAEVELDANSDDIKRYVELGALLDVKAAREKEAAEKKAAAEQLMEQAKAAAAAARDMANPAEETAQTQEELDKEFQKQQEQQSAGSEKPAEKLAEK
jgi:hypothetical protein